ncbi:hypothetical protein [Marinobacter sp.]|uniref:hypothetical protein n=1 Tax=Marinobacter sp. TaxID=50741 RepID=UPI002B491A38|nr:hypothetical protein [Marinobacter sp.]HKK57630.1 hypothetical protein [Marinobacter sp.]
MVLIVLFAYFSYLDAASDSSAWQYLMMSSRLSGSDELIIPALVAGYLLVLGLALRDPRGRRTYVVTDRRVITFYKGRKLRQGGPEKLSQLQVVKGVEGQIRNIGDVVWARVQSTEFARGRRTGSGRGSYASGRRGAGLDQGNLICNPVARFLSGSHGISNTNSPCLRKSVP